MKLQPSLQIPLFLATLLILAAPAPAFAFDYLEHLWFTDRACRDAQTMLASQIAGEPQLESAYLALALVCPTRWEGEYCEGGYKRAQSQLTELEVDSRAYSFTLGDYSALADHISRQGPVRNLPRARNEGLVLETLQWFTSDKRVGGPIEDVAEDACETDGLADWSSLRRDVDETSATWEAAGSIEAPPEETLRPLSRAAVARGPFDPAQKYSFDNPHYLDLVLRNHHHFGESAFEAWTGFHSVAVRMREESCADLVVIDEDEAEDLADNVDGWESVDWDDLEDDVRAQRVCSMLGDLVKRRLRRWSKHAPPALVGPSGAALERLSTDGRESAELADAIVTNMLSLVFEGTALHYLQDGLAGGHMRTIRSREALVEVKHDHDADNRDGVVATAVTDRGRLSFVAWGDGYLLGKPPRAACDETSTSPASVTACLLRFQRGLLSVATRASLIDWALQGGVFAETRSCEGALRGFVCMALPIAATVTHGDPTTSSRLRPGTLPVPPPDFSYESLSVELGYAPFEGAPSVGLRFAAFGEFDNPAHWLTSWQARAGSSFGVDSLQSVTADVGFGFHYRLWARVMVDLVPAVFVGIRDFSDSLDFFTGVSPRLGLTFLPEGWVKIPIEFTLHVEQPFPLYSIDGGFVGDPLEYFPRVALGFGLAYMH